MRCKLKLNSITQTMGSAYVDGKYVKKMHYGLKFYPVIGDNEENKKFFTSTPSGTFDLTTVNPDAVKDLVLDGEYYVDFTLAK